MATDSRFDLAALTGVCPICKGSGWICAEHPDLPFMHGCGAEGRACRCNPTGAMPPDVDIVAAVESINNVSVRRNGEPKD